jgi:hypothetical protein
MQDDLTRAQHYRALATQMRDSAQSEEDQKRRQELLDIANQYENLADKLVGKHVTSEGRGAGTAP